MTDRRVFINSAACSLLMPVAVLAQQPRRRIVRIAILSPGASEVRSVFAAFRSELDALGYVEGRDVALAFHFGSGSDRLPALAQAIARQDVDIVLADGRLSAQAMQAASRTLPIVAVAGEPVLNGLAASLSRPGGNVTGVATLAAELGPKQLEFLHEILPSARHVGVMMSWEGRWAARSLSVESP